MIINEMNAAVFPKSLLAKKKRTQILMDAENLLEEKSWQSVTCSHIIMK